MGGEDAWVFFDDTVFSKKVKKENCNISLYT
jgi:hypothetical protein